MKKQITLHHEQAAECFFELFKEKRWLLSANLVIHNASEVEQEAIRFLLAVAEHKIDDWGESGQAVRETVALLLTDFFAKLTLPNSPFANRTWVVKDSSSLAEQALEIMIYEIGQSHAHVAKPH